MILDRLAGGPAALQLEVLHRRRLRVAPWLKAAATATETAIAMLCLRMSISPFVLLQATKLRPLGGNAMTRRTAAGA
jgi:hypothetical protein